MLISIAHAAEGGISQELLGFLPALVIFALFWMLLIRPQMKQAKEQKAMQENLQKGDEVATTGGVLGKVSKVSDQFVALEIASNVTIHVQRQAILTVLPKGTIKAMI